MLSIAIALGVPFQASIAGGAAPVAPDAYLLETGGSDYFLLESGGTDYMLLES
jgi:hypothetical protein